MPEGDQQQDSLGWRAGLSDDLKAHESVVPYKTVSEFAKAHIETANKLKDTEGKLTNSIPKLSENATQEERNRFFNSLGRPEKPEGYQLEGGDKDKEAALQPWKQDFYELGLTDAQAKGLKAKWDGRINQLVEAHQAKVQKEIADTSTALKTELGDKYDASIELASRLWKQWGKTEVDFDKAFASETSQTRVTMIRFLLNVAAKTGEDVSLRSGSQRQQPTTTPGYDLSVFNLPAHGPLSAAAKM
jgi:hypothetical protein